MPRGTRIPLWRQRQIDDAEAKQIAEYYDRHPVDEAVGEEIDRAIAAARKRQFENEAEKVKRGRRGR